MSKRTIIIVIIALLLIIAIAGYLIWVKTTPDTMVDTPTVGTNPFGSSNDTGTIVGQKPTTDTSTSTVFTNNQTKQIALVKIVDAPTGGGAFVQANNTTDIYLIDKASGNTFSFNPTLRVLARLSNTTLPRISQSLWTTDGKSLIAEYLDDNGVLKTYSAQFVPGQMASSSKLAEIILQGKFLPPNISALALSPSTAKLFYILPTDSGSDGYIANIDGTKATKIFTAPLAEWLVSWPQEGTIVLTTKPASSVPGHVYSLNTKTGGLSELIGGPNGLTALLSPTGSKVAYTDDSNRLQIYSPSTGATLTTSIFTRTDKCVWSQKEKDSLYCAVPATIPSGNYPDAWYQGLVSFTDSFVKINTVTNSATIISKPADEYNQNIDATNLSLSKDERYLLFMNKKDYTLWTLNLEK
jgi:hypothetical protein